MKLTRAGFTLFELILAVALSAILLTLIGTAINLYLMRIDADRTRVEEAQLARSVLTMIANDIREASIYKPQDTTQLAQLMLASTPFNVDSIDNPRTPTGSPPTGGAPTSPSSPTTPTKLTSLASSSSTSGTSTTGTSGSSTSANGSSSDQSDNTLPLGLNGSNVDLYVDVTHLPRQEELFSTVTGYTNAQSAASQGGGGMTSSSSSTNGNVDPPSDLKTIHYYVRPGNTVEPGSVAATSLAPAAQASAGGLVREQAPRQVQLFSEQQGNSGATSTGATLIAPEVVQIQFQYFDGSQLTDDWDMRTTPQLPVAIQVCIWLKSARANSNSAENSSTDTLAGTREYKQVVFLPMAALSAQSATSSPTSTTDSSSTSDSTGTSPESTPDTPVFQ